MYDDVEYGILMVYAAHESALNRRAVDVLSELGETTSHAVAAVRREARERTLTTLQRSTRQLLHLETRADIADLIVETLTGDLRLADAAVYALDPDSNALDAVSSSARAGSGPVVFEDGDSTVRTAFVRGETRVAESSPGESGDARRTMAVPLGDHGVLAVAVPDRERFGEQTRDLVELVAATAEAAFDRVETQTNLRERDELLRSRPPPPAAESGEHHHPGGRPGARAGDDA